MAADAAGWKAWHAHPLSAASRPRHLSLLALPLGHTFSSLLQFLNSDNSVDGDLSDQLQTYACTPLSVAQGCGRTSARTRTTTATAGSKNSIPYKARRPSPSECLGWGCVRWRARNCLCSAGGATGGESKQRRLPRKQTVAEYRRLGVCCACVFYA